MKYDLPKNIDEELYQYLNNIIDIRNKFTLYEEIKCHIKDSVDKTNKYPYTFYTIVYFLQHSFILDIIKLLDNREEKIV